MYRLRLRLPLGQYALFHHQDLLHDALINAWIAAGANREWVIGSEAHSWTFAVLGRHRGNIGRAHSLVIATSDHELSLILQKLDPETVRYARASTQEMVSFAGADVLPEQDPIPPGKGVLGCLMLSPLVVSDRNGDKRRWITDLRKVDLAVVINRRLSRLAGRSINLVAQADDLYLRANPKHSVLVSLKRMQNGSHAFVIGMQAPLVLAGSEEDLRFAWYSGIGEKTRNGFGCLGLSEQGVGR